MSADRIHHLEIMTTIYNIIIVKADGREVYNGSDPHVVDRWTAYFVNQTPYDEIYLKEAK